MWETGRISPWCGEKDTRSLLTTVKFWARPMDEKANPLLRSRVGLVGLVGRRSACHCTARTERHHKQYHMGPMIHHKRARDAAGFLFLFSFSFYNFKKRYHKSWDLSQTVLGNAESAAPASLDNLDPVVARRPCVPASFLETKF